MRAPSQNTTQRLARLLQKARLTLHLSQRSLSSMSGVPQTTIIRLEHGEVARPRPDVLSALASALALPLADVYAALDYEAPVELPSFAPYLRQRYGLLSSDAIEELSLFFENLARREGILEDGLEAPQESLDPEN